jgi:integrase
LSYYREQEITKVVNDKKVVVGVRASNPISLTLGRIIRQLDLVGVTPYRFRHTFKTLGKRAKDPDALNLCMGHEDNSVAGTYDHEQVPFKGVKRVAIVVKRQLWPKRKHREGGDSQTTMKIADEHPGEKDAAA